MGEKDQRVEQQLSTDKGSNPLGSVYSPEER